MADPTPSDAVPKTKLDEQTSKGVYSYTYFHREGSVEVAPPRKLTDEEAAAQAERDRAASATGTSAWNAAGTFEERDWTGWARDRVKALVRGATASGAGGVQVEVTDVTDVTGHANAWIRRGKKTHGFDLQITLSWAATVGSEEIRGTAKCPNAASDELDELSLESVEPLSKTAARAAQEAAATKAVTAALPDKLREALEQLLEELKQK
uniref:Activator of Hsp90 ATPase AHSA1-like N-terminal domain-containing protein n=1 Tax=Chlamydomonas leiostraca TaxID=1034604 RepID=A0A7S0WTF0_9CHLO|mmetsp:Transcript_27771/g.70792  ORF Transcript_27771/g.70792 Transcript_27771/m.70792 type:complete len:209 (+) Transcript_27771:168-794(+)|eukprot:CAMPEP_0202858750 /NCGR_PEP_ID=MMETSP1391-20130828/1148_1 /ASSEMBLY_ACC=CAM_ASM_000867 /TAXON_ID=1034604 /ORGANISM="Chlamydomonas leiostraca, Strain SAG 11-49" /LENGTH=208 /DNA_ID=CAMNT_0049537703 /DNA_START=102 /DNA_END=728 /DNA_ORIENTATION=-